jgi:hypothetical protein
MKGLHMRGFRKLDKAQLPKALQASYSQVSGLLKLDGGFQALLVQKDGDIFVALTGTRDWHFGDYAADVSVVQGPLKALRMKQSLAVVRLLLEKMDVDEMSQQQQNNNTEMQTRKLIVVGHSLGGSCAQYAVGGNLSQRNKSRLVGVCFNAPNLHDGYREDMPTAAQRLHRQCIHQLCLETDSLWGKHLANKFWLGTRYLVGAMLNEKERHPIDGMLHAFDAFPYRNEHGVEIGNSRTGRLLRNSQTTRLNEDIRKDAARNEALRKEASQSGKVWTDDMRKNAAQTGHKNKNVPAKQVDQNAPAEQGLDLGIRPDELWD